MSKTKKKQINKFMCLTNAVPDLHSAV